MRDLWQPMKTSGGDRVTCCALLSIMGLFDTNSDKVCREFRNEALKGIASMKKMLDTVEEEIKRTNDLQDNPPPASEGPCYTGSAFPYVWLEMLRKELEGVCYPLARCNGACMVRGTSKDNVSEQPPHENED